MACTILNFDPARLKRIGLGFVTCLRRYYVAKKARGVAPLLYFLKFDMYDPNVARVVRVW
jgi:hypothetical protein